MEDRINTHKQQHPARQGVRAPGVKARAARLRAQHGRGLCPRAAQPPASALEGLSMLVTTPVLQSLPSLSLAPVVSLENLLTSLSPIRQPGLILAEGPELCRGCRWWVEGGGSHFPRERQCLHESMANYWDWRVRRRGKALFPACVVHVFLLVVKKDSGLSK